MAVNRLERQRARRLRTVYVSSSAVFNKERGLVSLGSAAAAPRVIEGILGNLEYGFDMKDMPKLEEFDCRYVVQTDEYKAADGECSSPTWRGTVVAIDRAAGNREMPFSSRDELAAALA